VIVSRPPFVVVAESNSTRAARYEEAVRSIRLAVRTVGNGDDALALMLRTPSPALLLANALLPRIDGASVVRHMRAVHVNVPAILLGGSPQLLARLLRLRIPNTEVFTTYVDREELRAAISRMVAPSIEGTSTSDGATPDRLAPTEPLNRGGGSEALIRESSRVERGGSRLSVALFGVDGFERINEQYGREVADQVLAEVGREIARLRRVSDTAIRWGADEFLVLLPHVGEEGARAFAERVRSALALVELPSLDGVSVSFGTAEMRAGDSIQDTIGLADQLLYRAKATGRKNAG
jgi:diguanylate cyclase (GGDEF)-like protein